MEDLAAVVVLLRPENAVPAAPLLRMELDRAHWDACSTPSRLTVAIAPEHILLFQDL